MKSFVVLKRTGMIFSVLALFLALLFSSCDNVSGGGSQAAVLPVVPQATPAASSQQKVIVTFCGSVGVSGALPQEVAAKVSALAQSVAAPASASENSPEVSRSARPDLNPTDYYYYVSADPQDSSGNAPVYYGKDDQGKFVGGSSGVSYEIGLPVGSWIIECGLKSAATDKPVLRASSGLITLTESDSVVSKSFTAVPVSDAGNGSVLLVINKGSASAITTATASWKNAANETVIQALVAANTITDPDYTGYAADVLALKVDNLAPGAYDMTISFYDENGVMLYQTVQTVGVFSGMKTNSWVTDGGTDSETGLITGDGFTISAAAVAVFKSSVFYVGDTGATMPGYRGPSNSNEGTFLAPFASLQKAVDTISVLGDGSTDYKIYVRGTLEGTTSFQPALNNKAKSIAIEGMDSSAKLCRGNSGGYNVLYVTSTVPVSIKNIQIAAKAGDANSRGIYIGAGGSSVTLLEGTVVSGHTYGPGAGVYDYQGKLYVKGATISGNNASSGTDKFGGGVCVATGGVMEMTSGEISGNAAADKGGAVYVAGVFTIGGSASIPLGSSNDVYLCDSKMIDVGALGGSGVVATITPFSWARNASVLRATSSIGGTMTPEICGRFAINSEGFSIKKSKVPALQNMGVLAADIFVAPDGDDGAGVEGTKQHPFKSLARAVDELSGGEPETIWVNGTLTASDASELQKIPANCSDGTPFDATKCSALTIKGYDSATTYKGVIDANSKGTALTVATSVPVTIENLKITGGYATNGGGGITVSAGSVTLSDRAWITKNIGAGNSYCGGGARVDSGAKLFMRGTALIGNKVTSAPTSKEDCLAAGGNTCESSSEGGGILNSGSTFIGCDEDGNASDAFKLAEGYGVMGNWALQYGGGIGNKGILKIGSGEVSFNMADNQTVGVGIGSSSSTGSGGGIYQKNPSSGSAELFICGGKIRGNKAVTGGGVNISSGSAQMLGGTIGGSDSADRNEANLPGRSVNGGGVYIGSSGRLEMTGGTVLGNSASGNGGAVYVYGTFAMSGAPNIPLDSEKKNDVYLASGKTISVGNFDAEPATVATITLFEWKRKTDFLTSSNVITTQTSKFNFTQDNDGWERKIEETYKKNAYIFSPIYVVDANDPSGSGKTRPDGFNPGVASGATGTKTSPYASVAAALGSADLSLADNTITVAGTLKGAQTISGTVPSSLILTGYNSAATIDAGGGTDAGSALTMNASGKSVTISDLTITGGKAENGGGINISDGTVTLSNFANVVGNSATSNGGGVYVGENGTLYMNGTSLVGDTSQEGITWPLSKADQNDTSKVNYAPTGGGIYSKGAVYLGCNDSGTAVDGCSLYADYGVRHNNANNGGGVYIAGGDFKAASGQISFNRSGENGAGIYASASSGNIKLRAVAINSNNANSDGGGLFVASGCTVDMDGAGSIAKNKASSGGGVQILGTFNMSAGCIGGESSDYENYATNSAGVSVYVGSSSPYPKGTFNMSGGSISYNRCSNNGGGVSISSRTISGTAYKATFNMSGGTISNNSASNGGAVMQAGVFNMSGSASIPFGVTIDGTKTESPGYNDVYLFYETSTITLASSTLSGGTTVATITPKYLNRGTNILDAATSITIGDTLKGQFNLSTDNSGWERKNKTESSRNYVYITSPIYVAGSSNRTVCSAPPESGNTGLKDKPYATIAAALSDSDLASTSYTITIDGKLGAQSIGNGATLPSGGAITVKGYDANAKIDGGGTARALLLSKAGLTTTIKDLTITNGKNTEGAGIKVENGTLKLTDGAIVTGNDGSGGNGGGVYVSSGASLFMYGKALIGDNAKSTATATGDSASTYANKAKNGAGIYNYGGSVYLGYSATSSPSPLTSNNTDGYFGVSRNYATESGGGIYHAYGTLQIASGNVSYNQSATSGGAVYFDYVTGADTATTLSAGSVKGNKSGQGGALYIKSSKSVTVSGAMAINGNTATSRGGAVYNKGTFKITGSSTFNDNTASSATTDVYGGALYNCPSCVIEITGSAEIKNNTASTTKSGCSAYGGAIMNDQGSLTMSAGTIGASGALNYLPANTGTSRYGGAIYQNGTFNISGTAYVYPGTEKNNDVYLATDKYVTIDASWGGSQASNKMAITPAGWKRGKQVLDGTNASTYYSYFKGSEDDWLTVVDTNDSSKVKLYTEYKIYVAGTGHATGATGVGDGKSSADGGLGTKAKPYDSISEAVNQCWTVKKDFTIYISGFIENAQQTIPAKDTANNKGLAQKITLAGFTGTASDGINRNLTEVDESTGSALVSNTDVPVTITCMTIKGGFATGGGGIYVNKSGAKLVLDEGTNITGNTSTGSGGGVYFKGSTTGKGTLVIKGTNGNKTYISGNSATGDNSYGGGIYMSSSNLYISGYALIGATSNTYAYEASDKHSNFAKWGGGIFATTDSSINLGYDEGGSAATLQDGYGVRYNYASVKGGGINCFNGVINMASGSVSNNGTNYSSSSSGGGGLYLENTEFTITNGTIDQNIAYAGGGIYLTGQDSSEYHAPKITMANGLIGDTYNNPATSSSCRNFAYSNGGGIFTLKGNVYLNGGTVGRNYGEKGGGVYISNGSAVTVKNTFQNNGAGSNGGAIYNGGTLYVEGAVNIPYGGEKKKNDVYLYSQKHATVSAAITNTNATVMTIVPYSYTVGSKVVAKKDGVSDTALSDAIEKTGIVPDYLYNIVEKYGNYGQVGTDLTSFTSTTINNHMTAKSKTWLTSSNTAGFSEGVNYFLLRQASSTNKVAIIRFDNAVTDANRGSLSVVYSYNTGSGCNKATGTSWSYDKSSGIMAYYAWTPFGSSASSLTVTAFTNDGSLGMNFSGLDWYKLP